MLGAMAKYKAIQNTNQQRAVTAQLVTANYETTRNKTILMELQRQRTRWRIELYARVQTTWECIL
jgi:hypothetical protein